ncbi:hypothetical protein N566_09220 [Streptomycetaceae bacterium MP113-05]|nr:hypothetical protein N566_09220 [Streptomycetaceae bacterium MP113-05]
MKYMLMLMGAQKHYDAMSGTASPGTPAWTEDQLQAMFQHMEAINDDLSAAGELVDARGLSEPSQARLVTAGADGRPVVSDGPYGETKEVLAGYWIVDVETPERVYEIAARAYSSPAPECSDPEPPVIVRPIPDGPPDRA